MARCWYCSIAADRNGQNKLADMNLKKSLSLREIADTIRQASAPPARCRGYPLLEHSC